MKNKYLEPELEKITIITSIMENIDLSKPEDEAHIGHDDDTSDDIGG